MDSKATPCPRKANTPERLRVVDFMRLATENRGWLQLLLSIMRPVAPISMFELRNIWANHTTECGAQRRCVASIPKCHSSSKPQPGEITLAHHGVLFLDELPEFDRKVLEVLREPLESGYIVIARAKDRVRFPARFQLVAAMNPCPCGYLGEPSGKCSCTPDMVQRYRNKLSGPLLDRIDLHLTVAREATALNPLVKPGEDSASAAAVVAEARERQQKRQRCANAFLDLPALKRHCQLSTADEKWLESACERLTLSLRSAHRLLKVARTLADLEQVDAIKREHLAEALQYRPATP